MAAPAPAAAATPSSNEPFPLSYGTLLAGYRKAEELIREYGRSYEQVVGSDYGHDEDEQLLGVENPGIDAAIMHAMAPGIPGAWVMKVVELPKRLRLLAMVVANVRGYGVRDGRLEAFDRTLEESIEDILRPDSTGDELWSTPDVRRFLFKVVPQDEMDDFIAQSREFGAAMGRARDDELTRISLEQARFGSRAYNDAIQLVAQRAAPSAVTPQRPLCLIDNAAQRARNAPYLPLTNMQVLEEIITTFDDDPEEAKRKLIDLHRSARKRIKLMTAAKQN